MKPLITLTTDFGTRDGFVAQMKGVILGINREAELIDVTHDIHPFSVMEGALVLKGVAPYFPSGTIHVVVVDPGVGSERRAIALRSEGRYYVGPDNGVFSLVMADVESTEARGIENPSFMRPDPSATFHGRDLFAPVAAHLSLGARLDMIGPLLDDPVILSIPAVKELSSGIEGEVIHVDRFGNLVSNIEASMLDRPVEKVTAGKVEMRGISTCFSEGKIGEPLALINSFGHLEIAVNQGDASRVLDIGPGEQVTVLWA
ncbi:MAG: SAM-dependent chlorinase/fluorinase [Deltaproteobacteria bacterium]